VTSSAWRPQSSACEPFQAAVAGRAIAVTGRLVRRARLRVSSTSSAAIAIATCPWCGASGVRLLRHAWSVQTPVVAATWSSDLPAGLAALVSGLGVPQSGSAAVQDAQAGRLRAVTYSRPVEVYAECRFTNGVLEARLERPDGIPVSAAALDGSIWEAA